MKEFDVIIIGAGVIGCSTAVALTKIKPDLRLAVLEKEHAPAQHTSGRNSGVVHSGFNPKPGSLKASFCVEGNRRLQEFCKTNNLPISVVGTLVVALEQKEVPVSEELHRRGVANGVPGIRLIDGNELRKREPHALGIAALHSPSGAIASSPLITAALANEAKQSGCEFLFDQKVIAIEESSKGLVIRTSTESFLCQKMINCSGLYADEIAHLMHAGMDYTIVPFRGEYYKLHAQHPPILNSMLYPAPDLNYPFLGVHWTKKITGETWIGPNATMAMGREAYGSLQVVAGDVLKMITKPAFWKMMSSSEFRMLAWQQMRVSLSKRIFVEEARKLIQNVKEDDFTPAKSGIRAQLVNRSGELVEDVVVEQQKNAIHVLNAISPGFTCALPFGEHLAKMALA